MNPGPSPRETAIATILFVALLIGGLMVWFVRSHPSAPAVAPVAPSSASSTASAPPSSALYVSPDRAFSIRYPIGWAVDGSYQYQELGPGTEISGVKFTIPSSDATGTNLASDSYLSVEEIPNAASCSAGLFLDQGALMSPPSSVIDGGTAYSVASSTGAGAGNRYEETVYAIPGTDPCIAVRYFIHYGVIDNYPPGAVRQFDEAALVSQFDAIRRTLAISR